MLPLEDKLGDILGKARRGLGLSHAELARETGSDEGRLKDWEAGRSVPSGPELSRLAQRLKLSVERLSDSAHQAWYPAGASGGRFKNFLQIVSPYEDMTVNCYLCWDPAGREAALFDTGTDFEALRRPIDSHGLKLKQLFLTHAHADHIALLEEIGRTWKPEVLTSKGEYVRGARPVGEGDEFRIGRIPVQVLATEGHSPGGLSFVLRNLGEHLPAVAVVGDALFAGSIGGPNHSYERLLDHIKRKILTLPGDTLLAPGHGPLTTVEEERRHNPFLA